MTNYSTYSTKVIYKINNSTKAVIIVIYLFSSLRTNMANVNLQQTDVKQTFKANG